jgi:hypothetical protein
MQVYISIFCGKGLMQNFVTETQLNLIAGAQTIIESLNKNANTSLFHADNSASTLIPS